MATSIKPRSPATPRLSVVVLVYNEAESIAPLHEELIGVLEAMGVTYEVVYIDDGSRDGSTERVAQLTLNDPHVRVVSFRRNFGQTAAVQAGIDNARGEVLVFMDGDMQNDPHDIPRLLQSMDAGYEVVSGWRKDRQDEASRVLPSRIANWIIARVTGVPLHDFGCTLKAYHRDVIRLADRLRPFNVNVALLPIGGRNFSVGEAAQLAADIGATWLVPMHYGTFDDNGEESGFVAHLLGHRPEQAFKVFQC